MQNQPQVKVVAILIPVCKNKNGKVKGNLVVSRSMRDDNKISRLGKLQAWETDRKGKIPQKCLGAKGLLDPGSKGLRKAFCTTQNCFCTGAKWGCTGAKGFSETFAPWVQKTFCTLP